MSENEENESQEESKAKPSPSVDFPTEMSFTLSRREVKIKLQDPRTDRVTEYTLRELDGTERDKYLNNLASRMKVDKGGKPQGIKDFKDLQADLVSRSLVDGENTNVPIALIQRWPVHVQTELFKMAQKLSALEEGAEEDAKNG